MERNFSSSIKKLIKHLRTNEQVGTGLSDDFEFATHILSQETTNSDNFSDLSNRIEQWLYQTKSIEAAERFSVLNKQLAQSNVLHNKANLLQFLMSMKNSNSGQNRGRSSSSHKDTSNSRHSSAFSLPKTYSNDDSRSSSTDNEASNQARGRSVARLSQLFGSRNTASSHEFESRLKTSSHESRSSASTSKVSSVPKSISHPSLKSHQSQKKNLVSKQDLLREVIFSLHGLEGNILKFDLILDTFKIDEKVLLTRGEREMVLKISSIGWLYLKLKNFCDATANLSASDNFENVGLVNQSLILALKGELNEYSRLVVLLEGQLNNSRSLGESSKSSSRENSNDFEGGLTLRRLMLWTFDPRFRLKTLACVTHSVKSTKGGASVSALNRLLHHGDAAQMEVVRRCIIQAFKPIYLMLMDWLLNGTLQDPFDEFFISEDTLVANDKLWHHKYELRLSMLPSFINQESAKSILVVGKSLNFLRIVCDFKLPTTDRDSIKKAEQKTTVESLISSDESRQITHLVDLAFKISSKHVLDQIMKEYRLSDHLRAVRRYLLLGQGDFIQELIGLLWPELNKSASRLHPHNLASILDCAIGSSCAQYDDSEILKRLDVRLMESSPGETGWHVFSLDYHVDGPIGTVFTQESMRIYLTLFNSLWRAKRMEKILASAWKKSYATSKMCRQLPNVELKSVVHKMQLLLMEVNHLLVQMEYYMTFEVVECSWHDFNSQLERATSLDDVIKAHGSFLKRVVAGLLLDEHSTDLLMQLRAIYDLMLRLETLQQTLYDAVSNEVDVRNQILAKIELRTKKGLFGTYSEIQAEEKRRKDKFTKKFINKFKTDLNVLAGTYQELVLSLLLMLAKHHDEKIQLLSTRLDFNDHYHRKDKRHTSRLTFMHKRKSLQ